MLPIALPGLVAEKEFADEDKHIEEEKLHLVRQEQASAAFEEMQAREAEIERLK